MEELTHNKGHSRLHVYTSLLLTSVMVCMLGIKFELCSQALKSSPPLFLYPFTFASFHPTYTTPALYFTLFHTQFTLHTSNSHSHCHSFLFAPPRSQLPSVPFFHPLTRPLLSPFTSLLPSLSPSFFHTHSVLSPLLSFMPSLRPSILPLSSLYPPSILPSLYIPLCT